MLTCPSFVTEKIVLPIRNHCVLIEGATGKCGPLQKMIKAEKMG